MKLRIIGKPFIKHSRFTVYYLSALINQERRPENLLLGLFAIK